MIKSVLQHWLWHLAADLSPLVPWDLTKLLGVLRNCNKTSVSFIAAATWRTQPKLSWPECYLSVETAAFLIAAVRIVGTSTASKVLCKHHCGPRTPACKDVPFGGRFAVVWGWFSHGLQARGEKVWEEPASAPAPAPLLSSIAMRKDSHAAGTRRPRTAAGTTSRAGWQRAALLSSAVCVAAHKTASSSCTPYFCPLNPQSRDRTSEQDAALSLEGRYPSPSACSCP